MPTLNDLGRFADQLPQEDKMPVLFLGHGSPMNAIEENEFVTGFRQAAASLPTTPKAILCISAHWYTQGTKVTAMEIPRTIHDFYGFPKELFEVEYPAQGNPSLAKDTAELLSPTNVELNEDWGLDHGAWSVIKHMYPEANIPVIQLSIDYSQNAEYHFKLAKQLSSLRDKGILIIGSGNIVHNLRMLDWSKSEVDNYGFDWAKEAREKVNQHILDGNFDPLLKYQELGQALNYAVPTPDHYLPLIYTLGLKSASEEAELFNDKLVLGSISMTSLKIG